MRPPSRPTELAVGIDIGTTSVKGVVVDPEGNVLAKSRLPHAIIASSPDRIEHDPRIAWRRSPRRILASFGATFAPNIEAIGVTGMGPSLTAVNRKGVPQGPGLIYGDARGQAQGGVGEAVGFLRSLAALHPEAAGFWPAQTTAIVSMGGPPVIGEVVAGMMRPLWTGSAWDEELLRTCGGRLSQMPSVQPETEPAGRWEEAVIHSGSLDVDCERLLAGQVAPDEALVLCGSTLLMMMSVPDGTKVPGVWVYPTKSGTVATGASNAGAFFVDWVDRVLARGGSDVHPDRVPVWCPYIRGERTPWHDPLRRAALVDLNITHDSSALRRAAFEAVAFVVRFHLELCGSTPRQIIAVGGGTAVSDWTQALADCVGVPVQVRGAGLGAAMGAAFMARIAAGLDESTSEASRWAPARQKIKPRAEWVAATQDRYRRFVELATSGRGAL